MYEARILADSLSPSGDRLTTYCVKYPRIVHAEHLRHRVFSFSCASTRAIPVSKTIEAVMNDPVMPVEWGLNQPGMQASETADEVTAQDASALWLRARNNAVRTAAQMNGLGLHKQLVGRLLEPWQWITVVVSGTDFQNFFELRSSRYSPLAQPELRTLADMMLDLYEASTPVECEYGEWHMPFLSEDDSELDVSSRKKVSAARCARVSYLTHDGVRDVQKDIDLADRLIRDRHMSPFEHVATPSRLLEQVPGNFTGWGQMRHAVEAVKRAELTAGDD